MWIISKTSRISCEGTKDAIALFSTRGGTKIWQSKVQEQPPHSQPPLPNPSVQIHFTVEAPGDLFKVPKAGKNPAPPHHQDTSPPSSFYLPIPTYYCCFTCFPPVFEHGGKRVGILICSEDFKKVYSGFHGMVQSGRRCAVLLLHPTWIHRHGQ